MVRFFMLSILIIPVYLFSQPTGTVNGRVVNDYTGEPLPNCNILVEPGGYGSITDLDGNYKLSLPYGDYQLRFSYVGYQTVVKKVTLSSEITKLELPVEMVFSVIENEAVTIYGEREDNTTSIQKLIKKDIRKMPTVYSDVLRTIKILPGVTSNNELSSGYNVRGGNFDENLIYLNGYEIRRPFLLRQGVEENQSLVNPDMVENVRFFGGAFDARYGDKMSSALEVTYTREQETDIRGVVRADLLNSGISAGSRIGRLTWVAGFRYAYPTLFSNELHTNGDYRPEFADGQVLLNYRFSENTSAELFLLKAKNTFNFTPKQWIGHFYLGFQNIKGVRIDYDGNRTYGFDTGLAGLRLTHRLGRKMLLTGTVSFLTSSEDEDMNLSSDVFYLDNPNDNEDKEYLKSRFEFADNAMNIHTKEAALSFRYGFDIHTLQIGAGLSFIDLDNRLFERISETGQEVIHEVPLETSLTQDVAFNSYGGYVQDVISLNKQFDLSVGLRYFYYDYSDESLISPRASIHYYISESNSVNFRWGYYYQPPFFYEIRNKSEAEELALKSQKSVHYMLGWEYDFEENLKLQVEAYYKDLDNIIPYYMEELNLTYGDANNYEGYSYGFDIMVQGEVVEGMDSWFGYSYLDSREREKGTAVYEKRILGQTHTLQIFLQDRIPRHPNFQAHTRILYGSGYYYHPRTTGVDDNGIPRIVVNYDKTLQYKHYLRADMGLSAAFDLDNTTQLVIVAEVLNVFNNFNVASYNWLQVLKEVEYPIKVYNIYTERFFNIGAELRF